ncbi:MAG TPA: methanogen output domain 1-containing protein [Gemmatimonadaceae bacterium]|nr:methanogen output domain 1-containing protein [Gemmatimonadaceae bacterium]
MTDANRPPAAALSIPLERDGFLRSMLRELAGTLQDVVGLDEAAGFVSVVGQRIGDTLNAQYREAFNTPALDRPQVAEVLVDLKRRIRGGFSVESQDDTRLVYHNDRCPFEEKVVGRPALCMMTSNVFGSIAADNLGYAKVELAETIASGASHCRVIVHLQDTPAARAVEGREYFGSAE